MILDHTQLTPSMCLEYMLGRVLKTAANEAAPIETIRLCRDITINLMFHREDLSNEENQ